MIVLLKKKFKHTLNIVVVNWEFFFVVIVGIWISLYISRLIL